MGGESPPPTQSPAGKRRSWPTTKNVAERYFDLQGRPRPALAGEFCMHMMASWQGWTVVQAFWFRLAAACRQCSDGSLRVLVKRGRRCAALAPRGLVAGMCDAFSRVFTYRIVKNAAVARMVRGFGGACGARLCGRCRFPQRRARAGQGVTKVLAGQSTCGSNSSATQKRAHVPVDQLEASGQKSEGKGECNKVTPARRTPTMFCRNNTWL